jgi:hypothetical protein
MPQKVEMASRNKPLMSKKYFHAPTDPAKLAHYSFNVKTIVPTLTGKWSLHFDGTSSSTLTVILANFSCRLSQFFTYFK